MKVDYCDLCGNICRKMSDKQIKEQEEKLGDNRGLFWGFHTHFFKSTNTEEPDTCHECDLKLINMFNQFLKDRKWQKKKIDKQLSYLEKEAEEYE